MIEKKKPMKKNPQKKMAIDQKDHRLEERRKEPCEGYTYITMVGWVCRREKNRRDKDKSNYEP